MVKKNAIGARLRKMLWVLRLDYLYSHKIVSTNLKKLTISVILVQHKLLWLACCPENIGRQYKVYIKKCFLLHGRLLLLNTLFSFRSEKQVAKMVF